MMFAGHLPTKRFDLAEWIDMPVFTADDGTWPGEGFRRSRLRGRPIVFFNRYYESGNYEHWAVRPVVRVPMRRA